MPALCGPSEPTEWQAMGGAQQSAHNPDLLPYNFHVFGLLQKALKGHTFMLHENVKKAVAQWLMQHSKKFFTDVTC
jgi:hypothetical protein